MSTSSRIVLRLALLATASLVGAPPAAAQTNLGRFSYAAKVVCGSSRQMQGAVPQAYMTSVNVHNPSDSLGIILKSLVVTLPPGGQRAVTPVRLAIDTLRPHAALATDCADLRQRSPKQPPFFEGFVLLESRVSLDVVAVYTVAGGIDVVHVPERGVVPR